MLSTAYYVRGIRTGGRGTALADSVSVLPQTFPYKILGHNQILCPARFCVLPAIKFHQFINVTKNNISKQIFKCLTCSWSPPGPRCCRPSHWQSRWPGRRSEHARTWPGAGTRGTERATTAGGWCRAHRCPAVTGT
jgi:hypothetical protein